MHIFFSVGEPSGDQHTAHLIGELSKRDANFRATGFGGPRMQAAGCRIDFQLTDLAVMGFVKVIPLLWKFISLYHRAKKLLAEQKPDAVVLVDFPGFNWWIAKAAKRAGIPVYYYMPPQLWAWASWRIRRVHKWVDHVLCALPFEYDWYRAQGVNAKLVGHPFFDDVAEHQLDPTVSASVPAEARVVGLLPGSRTQEVTRNWPVLLDAAKVLHERHPDVVFMAGCFKPKHREFCEQLAGNEGGSDLPIRFSTGKSSEVIDRADMCLMVSGSISLELLARETPAVVIYRMSTLFYVIACSLKKVDSATLPNLIAGETVYPEFPLIRRQSKSVDKVRAILDGWLNSKHELDTVTTRIKALRSSVVQGGASARAAEAILEQQAISSGSAAEFNSGDELRKAG